MGMNIDESRGQEKSVRGEFRKASRKIIAAFRDDAVFKFQVAGPDFVSRSVADPGVPDDAGIHFSVPFAAFFVSEAFLP